MPGRRSPPQALGAIGATTLGGTTMELTSPAFADGGAIPVEYCSRGVAGGRNVSPPLEWSAPPDGVRSFTIAVVDHHPVARMWVHWVLVDLPPSARSLPVGASGGVATAGGARELANTAGIVGWDGPQPPVGSGIHDYVFTVYTLDVEHLDLPVAPTAADVEAAVAGHTLASGRLTGRFGR
jgi:Raf kinase inhibitor-like YbhB/YbcL family protein